MISQAELFKIQEVQLSYKAKIKPSERPKIISSKDAEKIARSLWDENKMELQEEFKVMLLSRANRVIGVYNLSCGGVAGTVADPKLIFVSALKGLANGIILVHNHPSGNLTPSQADIDLTKKCREAGKFLEIQVLDHIIITSESYYSMADDGII
jgi:DNA repair protein RadC